MGWSVESRRAGARVLGLPIRDCAGRFNNCVPRRPKLSAIDITGRAIFERLYLVPGLCPIEPQVNCPHALPPPLLTPQPFLNFQSSCNFFRKWPLIFLVSEIRQVIWPSPGTLTEALWQAGSFSHFLFLRHQIQVLILLKGRYNRELDPTPTHNTPGGARPTPSAQCGQYVLGTHLNHDARWRRY